MSRHAFPGVVTVEHRFQVPLDHGHLGGETLSLFAREARAADKNPEGMPWLLYLQGGPGFPGTRPVGPSGWLKRALEEFRVLLLDERGTGMSTPVTHETLAALGDARAQADYLKHFRADAIVRDAEIVRKALVGEEERWTLLGQSYGGFCLLTYLSLASEGLRAGLTSGGLAPLHGGPDPVYRSLYPEVRRRSEQFYDRYPQELERVNRIADHLATHDVRLPGGGRLTTRRFQQLGFILGDPQGCEKLHYLLDEFFLCQGEVAYRFLRAFENTLPFETHPIYVVLHESIYCQGEASRWSAHRVRDEFPEFSSEARDPLLFTGEMIYPWMCEDYERVSPMSEVAEILADYDGWGGLYDLERLAGNDVPLAATIYGNDMYVARELALDTAERVGKLRYWITNELDHVALRTDGPRVLGRLLDMVRGMA